MDHSRLIPNSFQGRGEMRNFFFKKLFRSEHYYVFRVTQLGGRTHYEIWKRMINPRFQVESRPGSPAFGLWAWSMLTLDEAMKRFHQLNRQCATNNEYSFTPIIDYDEG